MYKKYNYKNNSLNTIEELLNNNIPINNKKLKVKVHGKI